jgi:hypothetical protein
MNGWIKLYRDLIEKPIWKCSTPEQKVILITLLCMANHDTQEWEWNGKRFICKPGQMITSLDSIAKACGNGVSGQNVRTAIKRFEKYEFLTNQSTKTGRLITIVNWDKYQVYEKQPNKDTDNDLTKTQQSTNKDLTTNKNDKNDKNDKNELIVSKDTIRGTDVQRIVDSWNSLSKLGVKPIVKLSEKTKRYESLTARIRQYDVDTVIKAINNIRHSNFLQGKSSSGFMITFDWLVKPNNFVKVLEGQYDNRGDKNDGTFEGDTKPKLGLFLE